MTSEVGSCGGGGNERLVKPSTVWVFTNHHELFPFTDIKHPFLLLYCGDWAKGGERRLS